MGEESEIVVQLTNSEDFKLESELADGEEVVDSVMYSISAVKALNEKIVSMDTANQELTVKLDSIDETKYATELKEANEATETAQGKVVELEETIAKFADITELEAELVDLRQYKEDQELANKTEKVNGLYAQFEKYLTKEDVEAINSDTLNYEEIRTKVYAIVTPIMEQKIQTLTGAENLPNHAASLAFSLQEGHKDALDNNKPKTLLEKLKNI